MTHTTRIIGWHCADPKNDGSYILDLDEKETRVVWDKLEKVEADLERHARALASALEHCQECCDGPCCAREALRAWKEYSNTP
jgi:hypothetical protein